MASIRARGLLLGMALALGSASCGAGVDFDVHYAPGFAPGGAGISVFGVFRDGRMSPESWKELGPVVAEVLGQPPDDAVPGATKRRAAVDPTCQAAYGDALKRARPELFTEVDDYARSNGI